MGQLCDISSDLFLHDKLVDVVSAKLHFVHRHPCFGRLPYRAPYLLFGFKLAAWSIGFAFSIF